MSEDTFKEELKKTGFDITPGALEVLKNSRISTNELIKTLENSEITKDKTITVKKAIDILFKIKENKCRKIGIISELKERSNITSLSIPLQKTFYALKKIGKESLPGNISRITKRRKKTEQRYLNMLVKLGLVKKVEKGKKTYFDIVKKKT